MRVRHEVTAVFDDPNLVSCAGLAPALQLAERPARTRPVDGATTPRRRGYWRRLVRRGGR